MISSDMASEQPTSSGHWKVAAAGEIYIYILSENKLGFSQLWHVLGKQGWKN